jgi:hypothetical protein
VMPSMNPSTRLKSALVQPSTFRVVSTNP